MTHRATPPESSDTSSYVCPVANADSFFPRPHPSASSAGQLGIASLAFGALAGIPAVLLARLVLREISDGNGIYTGERDAKSGLVLGWIGTLLSLSLVLYWTAASSALVGPIAVLVGVIAAAAAAIGKFWGGAPRPLVALGTQPASAAWPFWFAAAATILAGSAGLAEKKQRDEQLRREEAATCEREARQAHEAVVANRFDDARDHIRTARVVCLGSELIGVAKLDAQLPGKEREYRRQRAEEEAERRARDAAEKERQDAARFEERAGSILERLNAATSKAAQGRWLDARDELDRAAADLDGFRGTKLETSDRWVRFAARLDELKKKIAPNVERAERARAEQEEAKRKREEALEEAKRKREEALERAREAAEEAREATRRVRCCDGNLSPSCLCNGSHRGCCSHHGGICGCEE